MFNFDNSYLTLPAHFFSLVKPQSLTNGSLLVVNEELAQTLHISVTNTKELENVLFGQNELVNEKAFAQAYAGHQFGNFTMLGDGRAIVLGEQVTNDNKRFDIQLKGGGRTPYSRGGDGNATLKAMLREYLMSEAMHYLQIPTSRSLAVYTTGEHVYRQSLHLGAVVVRVMQSHIRIGTFEFASYMCQKEDVQALLNYTIERLFPHLKEKPNQALAFLEEVMALQIQLITNWMRVGFIHGVMNTDNVAICGETFDYGPCSFMNTYNPKTVYSSIDVNGRYAFANQPQIAKWNLAKLAQAILPLIDDNEKTAVEIAQKCFDNYDKTWFDAYYNMMLNKIGIESKKLEDRYLVDELLLIMKEHQLDYTNTFLSLQDNFTLFEDLRNNAALQAWVVKWQDRVSENVGGFATAVSIMKLYNPVFIPRNHNVEKALDDASLGNFDAFNSLLQVLKEPYSYNTENKGYLHPPATGFEETYQTFCGT